MVIKDVSNTYLEDNGINTKRLSRLFVYEKYGMYYVEVDYLNDAYRIVFSSQGEVLIPLEKIEPFYSRAGNTSQIFLDENNLLLPIKTDEVIGVASGYPPNLYQHLKFTSNGYKISEIFTSFPRTNERLLKHKILVCEGKLYNFSTDEYLNDSSFDRIFLEDDFDLRSLGSLLGYELPNLTDQTSPNELEEFVLTTRKRLLDQNLVIGYSGDTNQLLSFIDLDGHVLERTCPKKILIKK